MTLSQHAGITAGLARLATVMAKVFMMSHGSYKAASGHCVESPDKNPAGATAVCADKRSRTRSIPIPAARALTMAV